jgi:hypothetical protein
MPVSMMGSFAPIETAGQFELSGLHFPCYLRVFSPVAGWRLKAILYDGQDLADRPLAIKATDVVSGVVVMMTNRLASLNGSVTDSDNRPLKDYVVVAFAEDSEKLGTQTRYVYAGRPDQEGVFKISYLLPGNYLLVAVDTVEPGLEFTPEVLGRFRPAAIPVRLAEGVPLTVQLKIATVPAQR